jgi:peptidoglycan/LPS O-acetylase OafA/YrhL
MRLWLKDSERLPDPEPMRTDDRKALLAGIIACVLALAALVLFIEPLRQAGNGWWLWVAIAGLAIGVLGLVNTHVRHERERKN